MFSDSFLLKNKFSLEHAFNNNTIFIWKTVKYFLSLYVACQKCNYSFSEYAVKPVRTKQKKVYGQSIPFVHYIEEGQFQNEMYGGGGDNSLETYAAK